jgi:hypothetical protein
MKGVCVWLVGACMMAAASGAAAPDDEREEKIRDLREQIEQRMQDKDWSKATTAIRKLRILLKGVDREEADALLLRVKGEKEWEKIRKAARKKTRPGKMLGTLQRFLERYGEDLELRERGEKLRDTILADVRYVIDDFEEADADDYDTDTSIVPIRDRGEDDGFGLRWMTPSLKEEEIQFHFDVTDWTPYASISFWIHAKEKGGRITLDCVTENDNYFEAWNHIDWTGWKHIRIPLRGRGCRFSQDGKATWSNIQWIRFWKDEGKPIDIIIDEIQLEKAL